MEKILVPDSLISFPAFTDLVFFFTFNVKSLGVPSRVNERLKNCGEKVLLVSLNVLGR